MEHKLTDNLSEYLRKLIERSGGTVNDNTLDEAASELRHSINKEKAAAAGRIAAWLAHRINNPLGAISGNAQLLGRRIERDVTDDSLLQNAARYLETIIGQTGRCAEITGELLEFTRPRDLRIGSADVQEMIAQAVDLACYARNQDAVTVSSDQEMTIQTDRELFTRAVYEALDNGLIAAGDMGEVRVDIDREPNCLAVIISDSGAGISDDVLPKIFEPFFSTREKARGLGLTTSLEIMNQLQGSIVVDKTGPEGTVVALRFPA